MKLWLSLRRFLHNNLGAVSPSRRWLICQGWRLPKALALRTERNWSNEENYGPHPHSCADAGGPDCAWPQGYQNTRMSFSPPTPVWKVMKLESYGRKLSGTIPWGIRAMKPTVAHQPSSRGAESSLVWANALQSRGVRIRLTIATEAGFGLEWGKLFWILLAFTFIWCAHTSPSDVTWDIAHPALRGPGRWKEFRNGRYSEDNSNSIVIGSLPLNFSSPVLSPHLKSDGDRDDDNEDNDDGADKCSSGFPITRRPRHTK